MDRAATQVALPGVLLKVGWCLYEVILVRWPDLHQVSL